MIKYELIYYVMLILIFLVSMYGLGFLIKKIFKKNIEKEDKEFNKGESNDND